MTDLEFVQACAALPAEQLLPYLKQAEAATVAVNAAASEYAKFYLQLEDANKALDSEKHNFKYNLTGLITMIVMGVIIFVLGFMVLDGFFHG